MFAKSAEIPSQDQALPGRDEKIQIDPSHAVHGRSMVEPFPPNMHRLILGLGCFWGAERKFWNIEGVYTTAVGYSAGHTSNPSYAEVCTGMTGHNEVVLVVYDPEIVSLDLLLKVFWESHDPTQGMRQGNDRGTQYRSGIYYTEAMPNETPSGEHLAQSKGELVDPGGVDVARFCALQCSEAERLVRKVKEATNTGYRE